MRLLFLDRDGTLNRMVGPRPPSTPDEVELLPGVEAVLSRYVAEGWQLVIVSNQGGVASGCLSEAQAHAVQQRVIDLLPVPVAASYLCPHMPDGVVSAYAIDCPNRKPKPGFIRVALQAFGAQAGDCLFVGDAVTDKQAAEAAGVPYRWADRFFGWPIDRGLHTRDGRWVQVREARPEDVEAMLALIDRVAKGETAPASGRFLDELFSVEVEKDARPSLALLASADGRAVGWLALIRGRDRTVADLTLGVDPAYRNIGIGSLLMDAALEWAGGQSGLERICAQVRADNLPVSRLCCKFGFVEERHLAGDQADGGQELITLACYL